MKIVLCIGAMNQGGAERVIANLGNYLVKNNDVYLISTSYGESFYALNSKIHYITLDENNEKKALINRTFKRIIKLRKLLKEITPNVAIAFLPEPSFRLLIAKMFMKVKTIISIRNDPNRIYNSIFKKMIVKILYPSSDGFVFQTPDAQKWFPSKIQLKSTVIPNPINEDFVCETFKGKRKKEIVCVARLAPQKNHKLLISAFSRVSKKHDDYVLKLYGDGPNKNEIKKQIIDLKLKNKVLLMGESKNIKNDIYKSSIFVLSSDYEGMPNALMEAMALGIPCISTDCPCGGPRYLIKNGENGILVDTNDEDNLAQAINNLIEDEELAKKISYNSNKIVDRLNPEIINKEWERYILKIIYNDEKGK